jgi:aryl-alcohol dehydrogenase
MRARAAVLRRAGAPFEIEDVELDDPGPSEALIRLVGTGICHTDLVARHHPEVANGVILGHEGAGVVEAVGPGVTRLAIGDHVVLSYDSCGWCDNCLGGATSSCEEFLARNTSGRRIDGSAGATDLDGNEVAARWFAQSSFATYATATERNAVRVDPILPLELLGPLGCGLQTGAGSILLSLKVAPGSRVAVFGVGAVGLAAVMAARVAGAEKIVAIDLLPGRRELARELGATHTLDGAEPDLASALGVMDYALDTTGVPDVIGLAVASLRLGGVCGLVGAGGGPITLTPEALVGRSVRFILEGDAVPQLFIPKMIRLWQQGRFPFDRLIRTYSLDEINQAERDAVSGVTVKPVLVQS